MANIILPFRKTGRSCHILKKLTDRRQFRHHCWAKFGRGGAKDGIFRGRPYLRREDSGFTHLPRLTDLTYYKKCSKICL